MEPPPALSRYRLEVDSFLRCFLGRAGPPHLYRMLRYHLGWEEIDGRPAQRGGKGLRPSLCLLACEASGGDWREALPAAAAVELVHNFSLIHDDIQDRDRERHHRPTVWSIWGEGQAINAGDALLALARLALLALADKGVPPDRVIEAGRVLDERTLKMVEGQVMDLAFEDAAAVDLASYLQMIEKKTGALFDCALRLGAVVAGVDRRATQALSSYGRLLGLSFQIRDDMLGVWGAENRTGKETAADIRRRKKSLPVVYAFANADGRTLRALEDAYGKPELGDEDVSTVLRSLDALGAQQFCARLAQEQGEAALTALEGINLPHAAMKDLRETANFLLERDF